MFPAPPQEQDVRKRSWELVWCAYICAFFLLLRMTFAKDSISPVHANLVLTVFSTFQTMAIERAIVKIVEKALETRLLSSPWTACSTEWRHFRWKPRTVCTADENVSRSMRSQTKTHLLGRQNVTFLQRIFQPTENSETFNPFDNSHIVITLLFLTTLNNRSNWNKYFLKKTKSYFLIPKEDSVEKTLTDFSHVHGNLRYNLPDWLG